MSEAERQALSQQIEAGRRKMYDAATNSDFTAINVVRVSQELDELIVRYMRVTA